MTDYYPLLREVAIGAALFVAYLVLIRRLADVMQPVRLHMANLGEGLLTSGELSPSDASLVQFYLDNAFSAKYTTFGAIAIPLLAPFYVIRCVVRAIRGRDGGEARNGNSAVNRLMLLFIISQWVTSPIIGTIFVVELITLVLTVVLLTGQVKNGQKLLKSFFGLELKINRHSHSLN